MKKYYILLGIVLFLSGSIVVADNNIPKPQGKHKSHKKAKHKKSGYYFNFQH